MDVSLLRVRSFFVVWVSVFLFFTSCGVPSDISTSAGQEGAIDQANAYLSEGECSQARNAISPLYNSQYVNDQVTILMASTYACSASFDMLHLVASMAGFSNIFTSLANSTSTSATSGSESFIYQAADTLAPNTSLQSAVNRSSDMNTYMVMVQLDTIAILLRKYGAPDSSGNKTTNLTYPGTLTNLDACALTAAFAIIADSFPLSTLNDSTTSSAVKSINSICVSAGYSSCAILNKDRTQCNGSNQDSTVAAAVVTGVNSEW